MVFKNGTFRNGERLHGPGSPRLALRRQGLFLGPGDGIRQFFARLAERRDQRRHAPFVIRDELYAGFDQEPGDLQVVAIDGDVQGADPVMELIRSFKTASRLLPVRKMLPSWTRSNRPVVCSAVIYQVRLSAGNLMVSSE